MAASADMPDAQQAALGRDLLIAERLASKLVQRLRLIRQRLYAFPSVPTGALMHYTALREDAEWIAGNLAGWDADAEDARELAGETEPVPTEYCCPTCHDVLSWQTCDMCQGVGYLGDTLPRDGGPCPECHEAGGTWVCWYCEEHGLMECEGVDEPYVSIIYRRTA